MTRLDPAASPRRSLRGAWWIATVVGVFFAAVAWIQVGEVLESRGVPTVGDGRDPDTYGFDLATFTIDRRWLAAGMPRGTLEPLDRPPLLAPAQVDSLNGAERGKYLVADDLVIGVEIGGAARAYPLRVLDWHEVADDTLGGRAITVARHPLSGSAVVPQRRPVGGPASFEARGLLWTSPHLLASPGGSLWAPLLGRAVGGPAAGDALAVLPAALVTWGAWRDRHPRTTVPWPDPAMRAAYKRDPYGNYASGETVRYPVTPLPPLPAGERFKDVLTVDGRHAYRFALQALGLL